MDHTTIAIRKDVKEKIMEFATKKETYSEVIERLLKSAEQRLLHDILMSSQGCVTIEEVRRELNKKWPRSK